MIRKIDALFILQVTIFTILCLIFLAKHEINYYFVKLIAGLVGIYLGIIMRDTIKKKNE